MAVRSSGLGALITRRQSEIKLAQAIDGVGFATVIDWLDDVGVVGGRIADGVAIRIIPGGVTGEIVTNLSSEIRKRRHLPKASRIGFIQNQTSLQEGVNHEFTRIIL